MGVTRILFVFGVALGAAVLLTPALRAVAGRRGWVDRPTTRKAHRRPVPLLGGVAICAAVLASLAFFSDRYVVREASAILVGASLVSLAGLWDDRQALSPWTKLAVQAAATGLLVAGGVRVALPLPEALDLALTFLWVVGVTNAFNLLDNVDGLAGGVASVASFFFLWLAAANGQYLVASLAAALLGACLGFLVYNFNPASIFMGDAGSLFLGFVLAAVGIKLRFPDNLATVTWMVPVLVLAVPLVDTAFVVATRSLRGVNPLTTPGRDHLSHRLIERGWGDRAAVATLWIAAIASGLAAVAVSVAPPRQAYSLGLAVGAAALASGIWLARTPARHADGEVSP